MRLAKRAVMSLEPFTMALDGWLTQLKVPEYAVDEFHTVALAPVAAVH